MQQLKLRTFTGEIYILQTTILEKLIWISSIFKIESIPGAIVCLSKPRVEIECPCILETQIEVVLAPLKPRSAQRCSPNDRFDVKPDPLPTAKAMLTFASWVYYLVVVKG